ncbi:MAG TPA: M3 family oligoendopeptidase [Phycisphaerales bacterium]|nr:M3 family oligoendopeptidase [Phycisphaerales bacterium]
MQTAVRTDFVPADLDATRWENVEPYFRALRDRPVESASDLDRWLIDRGELEAACREAEANLYVTMTCDTENREASEAFTRYIESVPPKLKPAAFELDKRQVELFARFPMPAERYGVIERDVRAEVELFREENVPIQTELEKLSQRYQQITGAMTVVFEGEERTLPQMGRYQESTDRAVRESAWRAVAERRLRDRDAIDETYDEMISRRDRMAKNAGCPTFVEYAFRSMRRFDYTPEDCFAFHRACEAIVVPFARRLNAERRASLGVDRLRPWDLAVDVKGRPPLRPFEGGRDLMAKSVRTFERLDPRLAAMLAELGDGSNTRGAAGGACLDLDSRRGKAPGGYQYMRDRSRVPFIFMNAAGLHRDVETMVHEAGHAFHSMLTRDEPLLHYRHSPIEFAEVASMSMELLTMPYWGGEGRAFYPDDEDAARARRQQLEGSVVLLPWIATIDAFQHWVYRHPTHSREQRLDHWLELDERFGPAVSWDGLEDARRWTWQRQPHLFGHAFYYIEYGIAQLGALQLWLTSIERSERAAIDAYTRALSLGGSRPLPELFRAAGLRFDFGPETVKRIVERVEAELEKLPE